jgi:ubiquinone/menaquinone biosynthesis C-methylase UbiE
MESNKKFMDPESILFRTGLGPGHKVVDLGAGSGFFAQASAKIVGDTGLVYVVDVMEEALEHSAAQARLKNYHNFQTIRHDLEKGKIAPIATGLADLVIAANVIHQVDPKHVLEESYRILKTGGKLLVIDWKSNHATFGPKHHERVSEEELTSQAEKLSFKLQGPVDTDQFHYGLLFSK